MREMLYVGTRPGRLPRRSRRARAGRVCTVTGCRTRLSIYNRGGRCGVHERPQVRRTIGRVVGTRR